MSLRKHLIKFAKRIEKSWQTVDLESRTNPTGVVIRSGWYVTEFQMHGSINHTPEILVLKDSGIEARRALVGSHSGRNRMLFFLPDGHIVAYDKALQFDFLSRVTELEGRARVLLISFRYLVDFFSFKVILKIFAMQFQNRFELSSELLQFYSPRNHYLYEIQRWNRFKGFNWVLKYLTHGIKIAVLIEDESQRNKLQDLLVQPDQILLAKNSEKIEADIDYVIPLSKTEQFRSPGIAIIKRAIKQYKKVNKRIPTILYSDHDYVQNDKANKELLTIEPAFKPQPSLSYLYCFNYIGPAVIFSTDKLDKESLENLLNDDVRYYASLALFQEKESILHIPELLFVSDRDKQNKTPLPTSTASAWSNIEWRRQNEFNILVADTDWQEKPSVDLIIPTRDRLDVLRPCIQSILEKTEYENYFITIVDNNSIEPETEKYFSEITLNDRIQVIEYPHEFNYSAINNLAVKNCSSDYIALVNNDIEVINSDWLTQMMVWATQPNVGIVGAKLLYGDGSIQHAGVTIGMGNAAGHIHRLAKGDALGYQNRLVATQNMMAVTAACLVTPRALFEEIGGLDETVFKVAYNDIDYCLKVEKRGLDIIWTPQARLYHHESISRGDDMSDKHITRYFNELNALQKRWKTKGFVDKYYNKYLRISDEGVHPHAHLNDSGQMLRLDASVGN